MNRRDDASLEIFEDLHGEAKSLVHRLNFLMGDLEEGFRLSRGKSDGSGTISFMFQEDSIDATLWLVGDAWVKARELTQKLEGLLSTDAAPMSVIARDAHNQ